MQQSLQPGEDATQILADSGEDVARQLNERPRETLQFETQQRDATPVLRRPVEPAPQQRTLLHSLVFAAALSARIVDGPASEWPYRERHGQSFGSGRITTNRNLTIIARTISFAFKEASQRW